MLSNEFKTIYATLSRQFRGDVGSSDGDTFRQAALAEAARLASEAVQYAAKDNDQDENENNNNSVAANALTVSATICELVAQFGPEQSDLAWLAFETLHLVADKEVEPEQVAPTDSDNSYKSPPPDKLGKQQQ